MDLMRADLPERTPQRVFELPEKPRLFHVGTVSRDHRYYATGAYIDPLLVAAACKQSCPQLSARLARPFVSGYFP